jgi:hypothetical protein
LTYPPSLLPHPSLHIPPLLPPSTLLSSPSITQYMGFGLSGSNTTTSMDGADVTIAWLGETGPMAVDYHLRSRNRAQVSYSTANMPPARD